VTQTEAEQIARILGQYHDAFAFLANAWFTGNRNRTIASVLNTLNLGANASLSTFGFAAIAFIFSHDSVAKPLGCADKLITPRNLRTLGVSQNDPGTNETPETACLRHLRNCFGHGRFTLTLKRTVVWVDLEDYRQNGTQSFAARCKAEQVIRIAERTLIKAHRIVATKALQ